MRAPTVPLALAGAALALVGGICGYFGIDFGYHLWSAARCATSSCVLDQAPWWVDAAGALAGGVAYVGLGLLAGLPRRSSAADPASPPTPPGWAERVAAALAHVGLWLGLPFVAAGVLVLVGSRATPFLRRHGVAALRLQLWQLLLLVPTPFLFWLTLGLYTVVVLAALLGGIGYAVHGAVRALAGDERAYPYDWPARAGRIPVAVDPDRRERRAQWALGVLGVGVLVRLVVAPAVDVMRSGGRATNHTERSASPASRCVAPGSLWGQNASYQSWRLYATELVSLPGLLDHPCDHPDDPTGPDGTGLVRRPIQREQASFDSSGADEIDVEDQPTELPVEVRIRRGAEIKLDLWPWPLAPVAVRGRRRP